MKKAILTLFILSVYGKGFCQQPAYTLPLPEKWSTEKITFPIDFAPDIPFKGNEELRFTPGWGKAADDDYWSYDFLWFIEGSPKINSDILQKYLAEYFNGLYRSNNKTLPEGATANFTKTVIKKVATISGDKETYEGNISTLNFLTGKPIAFFARIHVRNYTAFNHSALLFELSPKPYNNIVWQELDGIVKGFKYK